MRQTRHMKKYIATILRMLDDPDPDVGDIAEKHWRALTPKQRQFLGGKYIKDFEKMLESD